MECPKCQIALRWDDGECAHICPRCGFLRKIKEAPSYVELLEKYPEVLSRNGELQRENDHLKIENTNLKADNIQLNKICDEQEQIIVRLQKELF